MGPALSTEEEKATESSPRLFHAGLVEHEGDPAGFPSQRHQRGATLSWEHLGALPRCLLTSSISEGAAFPQSQACQDPWGRRAPVFTWSKGCGTDLGLSARCVGTQLTGGIFGTSNSQISSMETSLLHGKAEAPLPFLLPCPMDPPGVLFPWPTGASTQGLKEFSKFFSGSNPSLVCSTPTL